MRISNFRFASFFLRQVCKYYGLNFVDLEVEFSNKSDFVNGKLYIEKHDKFSKNLFAIISYYILNLKKITGKDFTMSQDNLNQIINYCYISITNLLKNTSGNNLPDEGLPSQETKTCLNHNALIWLILRDIISPYYNIPHENIEIIANIFPLIDIAEYCDDKIYVNMDVRSNVTRDVCILIEAFRGLKLDVDEVVKNILYKDELNSKLFGLLSIAYRDKEDTDKFKQLLLILSGINIEYEEWNKVKTAQVGAGSNISTFDMAGGMFWFVGLIEKLLGPARGANWDAYDQLKDYNADLYEKIREKTEERGMKQLPFEDLLGVQRELYHNNTDEIIQGLLSDARIW